MKKILILCPLIALLFLNGCTEPSDTTAIGAATGSAIGAGLGAIIGSQTGNAGPGLAIGAAAGAGTGALIANALQAQQEQVRSQDEAIERQGQVLRSQKSELDEIKRMNQTGDTYRKSTKAPVSMNDNNLNYGSKQSGHQAPHSNDLATSGDLNAQESTRALRSEYARTAPSENPPAIAEEVRSSDKKSAISEKDISAEDNSAKGSYNWNKSATSETANKPQASKLQTQNSSADCKEGESELMKGSQMNDSADRLFHFRRALRLCPNNPQFHNSLGEVYLSLNRNDDATFEFNEALRIDPGNKQARANLEFLKK